MRRRAEDWPFLGSPAPIGMVHRGGNAAGMEFQNTPTAIESAKQAGVTRIEVDIEATEDRIPVLFHPSLREPGRRVRGMTLEELNRYRVKNGKPELTPLEEVLTDDSLSDLFYNIDPKSPWVVEPLISVIRSSKAVERVCVGSFHYDRTKEVAQALGGGLCTSYFALGSVALRSIRFTDRFLASPASQEVAAFEIPHNLLSAQEIERLLEADIYPFAWARLGSRKKHDNPEFIREALVKGFPVVISDHTVELAATVRDYGNHSEAKALKE